MSMTQKTSLEVLVPGCAQLYPTEDPTSRTEASAAGNTLWNCPQQTHSPKPCQQEKVNAWNTITICSL
ncbi:hypothetical protein GDO81_013567 [Engystomops pustulosus]|uniref:Uncharacterized protein n=1 Tax=Engystomops pustulosus TaxID=76066 RepID=A0AAV7B0I1_ENGPU|nr:hypothetical protein GDO81_013567 [Engystomops pustulosus]